MEKFNLEDMKQLTDVHFNVKPIKIHIQQRTN